MSEIELLASLESSIQRYQYLANGCTANGTDQSELGQLVFNEYLESSLQTEASVRVPVVGRVT